MGSDEYKNFEAWMRANLDKDEISGLANHGADAGWPGLTYYSETCELYEQFKIEIWDALDEDSAMLGCKNVFEMMSNFAEAYGVTSADSFENLMTWYMAERTARRIADEVE